MCIKFKARCSLQCPLCCSSDVFLECSPSLGSLVSSWPVSVPQWSLSRSWRSPCFFAGGVSEEALLFLHHLCLYSRLHWSQANLWFRPLCWCGPVMWPSSVSSKYCWFKCNPLPVSNHVPSSKPKPESNSIFSSGLTIKSLWQSLLWLYFSIVRMDHVLATAGAAEKWLPENRTD